MKKNLTQIKVALLFLLLMMGLSSCLTTKPFANKSAYSENVNADSALFTAILIGDAGNYNTKSSQALFPLLQNFLNEIKTPSSLIFLGDNIYEKGLPELGDKGRKEAELRISKQIDVASNYIGNVVFVPGNHDWNQSKKGGEAAVLRQQEFIRSYSNNRAQMLPINAAPGPNIQPIIATNGDTILSIVYINTEWLWYKYEKPMTEIGLNATHDFWSFFEQSIKPYQNRPILFVGHHPIITNGSHGGCIPLSSVIFPFTLLNKNLYMPAPFLGLAYSFARKVGVSSQDISNLKNKAQMTQFKSILKQFKHPIYASGHEHALQLFDNNDFIQIVSGSGSKSTPLNSRKNNILFGAAKPGFCMVQYFSKETIISYFIVDNNNLKLIYRYKKSD